jgi:hypothetical protein
MITIKNIEMFEQDEIEPDRCETDEVLYYSFLPMFDDEDTYKMSDGRKQAFVRVAKWLFDCAGVTSEEFVKQIALDKPSTEE